MNTTTIFKYIHFDPFSATPKYRQLANAIIQLIENKKLQADDVLPSINEVSAFFEIARDTVEKGYNSLKKNGIIGSIPGKGYYIKNTEVKGSTRVFLMFNKLSEHKKIIYDAFVSQLGDTAAIDFYIYNNNFSLFKKLLEKSIDHYHYYVIIPHFKEGADMAAELINTLPKQKLIILDKLLPGITGQFGAVYENFEKDIYNALQAALPQLAKYTTINIIFPQYSYHPQEILSGFSAFCNDFGFKQKIVHNIRKHPVATGEAYINLMEDDLVVLIEKIIASGYQIGKDVGVISYNETALKKYILNGITTISTNFQMMGQKAAELIQQQAVTHIEANFNCIIRPSL